MRVSEFEYFSIGPLVAFGGCQAIIVYIVLNMAYAGTIGGSIAIS
jgi:hypothetical protein